MPVAASRGRYNTTVSISRMGLGAVGDRAPFQDGPEPGQPFSRGGKHPLIALDGGEHLAA